MFKKLTEAEKQAAWLKRWPRGTLAEYHVRSRYWKPVIVCGWFEGAPEGAGLFLADESATGNYCPYRERERLRRPRVCKRRK